MKIAFLVGTFPKLSETFILNQITGLIDRGHEVHIYPKSKPDEEKVHPDVNKYNLLDYTYLYDLPRNKIWRVIKALFLIVINIWRGPLKIIKSLNFIKYGRPALSLRILYSTLALLKFKKDEYDIIHCHFGPNGNRGVTLKEIGLIDGKILTTFHGYDVNKVPKIKGNDYYKKLSRIGDHYTVNTNFTGEKVIELGINERKISKLPVGVEINKFSPGEEDTKASKEAINILTVARLVEKKGVRHSIKAFGKLASEHDNVNYKIAGDGPLKDNLLELTKKLGIQEEVDFLGWVEQDEVINLYQNADIFVLSSITAKSGDMEGQGLVIQEAQAMKLPVISTLHNGIPEGVIDGETAFLVPEKDSEKLADKMKYLVNNPEERIEMGKRGREFIKENFDIEKLNDELVKIYREVSK